MVLNGFSILIDLGHIRDPRRPLRYRPSSIHFRHFLTTACSDQHRFRMERFSPVRRFRHRYYKLRFANGYDGFTRHRRNVHLSCSRLSRRSRFSSSSMGLFRFRMPCPLHMDKGASCPPLWNPQRKDTIHAPTGPPPLGGIIMKRFIIKTPQATPYELTKHFLHTISFTLSKRFPQSLKKMPAADKRKRWRVGK